MRPPGRPAFAPAARALAIAALWGWLEGPGVALGESADSLAGAADDGSCACERAAAPASSSDVSLVVRVLTHHADPIADASVRAGCVGATEEELGHTDAQGCFCSHRRCSRPTLAASHPRYLDDVTYDLPSTESGRARATMLLSEGAVVSGVVLGPGDRPLGGVKVSAVRKNEGEGGAVATETSQGSFDDPVAGTFELAGLAGGSWRIGASGAGIVPIEYGDVVLSEGERVGEVTIRAREGLWIGGRVVDATGTPVGGARVESSGGTAVVTGADGRFSVGGLAAGPHDLRVTATGFEDRTEARVFAGAKPIEVKLRTLGRWRGRVLDAESREPLASFWVDDQLFESVQGKFELRARDDRPHQLVVSEPAHAPRRMAVPRPRPGETIELGPIELDRGATVRGRLVGADGSPRPGLTVRAFGAHPDSVEGTSEADGTFELHGLSDGVWSLIVRSSLPRADDFQRTIDVVDRSDVSDLVLVVPEAADERQDRFEIER